MQSENNKNYIYITGTYALNLPSPDGTPGDWHFSSINWKNVKCDNTKNSSFGTWGLYKRKVPYHGYMLTANHIRACLDLIEHGYFSSAEGMKDNFINDVKYTNLIFRKVWMLKVKDNWKNIDEFMGREYLCKWLNFKNHIQKKEGESNTIIARKA